MNNTYDNFDLIKNDKILNEAYRRWAVIQGNPDLRQEARALERLARDRISSWQSLIETQVELEETQKMVEAAKEEAEAVVEGRHQAIEKLFKKGFAIAEIAEFFDCPEQEIAGILKVYREWEKQNADHSPKIHSGEQSILPTRGEDWIFSCKRTRINIKNKFSLFIIIFRQ